MPTQPLSQKTRYIWQLPDWPAFAVNAAQLAPALALARLEQGRLLGQLDAIGLTQMADIRRELWVQDTLATAAIEGEALNLDSVRSSVARRLGLSSFGTRDRDVDGLVELMEDASRNFAQPLTHERLYRWQAALFASTTINGYAGIARIAVGRYRTHADAMQIVSGLQGREVVHYQAPDSAQVPGEMKAFLSWFNAPPIRADAAQSVNAATGRFTSSMSGLVRAAIAHLWFESIHPFEDGNGRVGRAIADLALAQDAGLATRVFGLSKQMLESRKGYYDALNAAQLGGLDVTAWVLWFVDAFTQGCKRSQQTVQTALQKSKFWQQANQFDLNGRQRKTLARLLDAGDGGFLGGMTAEKHSKMNATSKPTATRDLTQLQAWGLLQVAGVGKGTRYAVNVDDWNQGNNPI